MDSSNTKFYHIATYSSLIICLFLSLFYSLSVSIIRNNDIQHYQVTADNFTSNVYAAVNFFLTDFVTNHINLGSTISSNPSAKANKYPNVKYLDYGIYSTLNGSNRIIFRNGVELGTGDYCDDGLIVKVTDSSFVCVNVSNDYTIVKQTVYTPAQVSQASRSEAAEHDGVTDSLL